MEMLLAWNHYFGLNWKGEGPGLMEMLLAWNHYFGLNWKGERPLQIVYSPIRHLYAHTLRQVKSVFHEY